jgi:hypothetical protein
MPIQNAWRLLKFPIERTTHPVSKTAEKAVFCLENDLPFS